VVAAVCAFVQEGGSGRIPGERNGFAVHDCDGAGAAEKKRRDSFSDARGRQRATTNGPRKEINPLYWRLIDEFGKRTAFQ